MPRFQVSYTVPVEVIVDTDTHTVERVVTIDEEIKQDRNEEGFPVVHAEGYVPTDDTAGALLAAKIAEDPMASWPVWEAGF